MGLAAITVGLAVLAALAASVGSVGRELRRRLVPELVGPDAVLAAVVLAAGVLVVGSELLGTVGLLHRGGLVGLSAASAGLAALLHRRSGAPATAPAPTTSGPDRAIAAGAVVATLLTWGPGILRALRWGVQEFDSLHYHLGMAALFVRTASTTAPSKVWMEAVHSTYPANVELVHAVGMIATDTDALVPLVGLGWLAVLLLSAWCVGARLGSPALAIAAVAVLAAMPELAGGASGAGAAGSDVAAVAFLLAGIALANAVPSGAGGAVVTGAALGLAVSCKLSVAPVVGLVVIAILWHERDRWRRWTVTAAGLGVGSLVTGGFWFVRNVAHHGSPLPLFDLPYLPSVATPVIDVIGSPITDYLTDGHLLGGPIALGWWDAGRPLVPGVIVAAAALLVARKTPAPPPPPTGLARARVWFLIAAAGAVAYLATPYTAAGLPDQPLRHFVGYNTRYAVPALAAALVGLVAAVGPRHRVARAGAVALLPCVLIASVLSGPVDDPGAGQRTNVAVAVLAAAAAGVAVRRWRPQLLVPAMLAGTAAFLVGAVWQVGERGAGRPSVVEGDAVVALTRSLPPDADPVGFLVFYAIYPATGNGWDTTVEFVVDERPHGGYVAPETCHDLVSAVNGGGYEALILGAELPLDGDYRPWLAAQPTVRPIASTTQGTVYAVAGPLDPSRCPTI